MSASAFIGAVNEHGYRLPWPVAAVGAIALGVWLSRALDRQTIQPFAALTFFVGCVLTVSRQFHLYDSWPFVYAVVWCVTLMFIVQTATAAWRVLRGIAA